MADLKYLVVGILIIIVGFGILSEIGIRVVDAVGEFDSQTSVIWKRIVGFALTLLSLLFLYVVSRALSVIFRPAGDMIEELGRKACEFSGRLNRRWKNGRN